MPRQLLTSEPLAPAGVDVSLGQGTDGSADGAKFDPRGGRVVALLRHKGEESPLTVTFQTDLVRSGLALPDLEVTVGVNQTLICGPFPTSEFAQRSGEEKGLVLVDFPVGAEADVEIKLLETPAS